MSDEIELLTMYSDPGIYEIFNTAGSEYEIEINEDPGVPANLLRSLVSGKVDNRDNVKILKVIELDVRIGQVGEITIFVNDEIKTITTGVVQKITLLTW